MSSAMMKTPRRIENKGPVARGFNRKGLQHATREKQRVLSPWKGAVCTYDGARRGKIALARMIAEKSNKLVESDPQCCRSSLFQVRAEAALWKGMFAPSMVEEVEVVWYIAQAAPSLSSLDWAWESGRAGCGCIESERQPSPQPAPL